VVNGKELSGEQLADLLGKAHAVVTWTTQGTLKPDAAGYKWLVKARQDYLRARIDAVAAVRLLGITDLMGCTCGGNDIASCMYHYGASLQPGNHRIPWNCPTYYDGCNCAEHADDEAWP
jgi:hypothetical protein